MKDKEFVEIDYIGYVKETGEPFDFTTGEPAKKYKVEEKPVVIIVGAGHVIKGLEEEIRNHKVGDEFEADIPPERAFGPRLGSLVKLVPLRDFRKHNLSPYTGMRVDFDRIPGTVRSVSGGRVIVDFNHPLAGKHLHYWLRINRKLTQKKEKADAILGFYGLKGSKSTLTRDRLAVTTEKEVPEALRKAVEAALKEHISLKIVSFQQKSKSTKK